MKTMFLDDLSISNKKFSNDILEDIDFQYKSLENCSFTDCKFFNVVFVSSNFKGLNFKHCEFINCIFDNCSFSNILFDDVKIMGSSIVNSKLTSMVLIDSLINGVDYNSNIEKSSVIKNSNLCNIKYRKCMFKNIDYNYSELRNISYMDSKVECSKFYTSKIIDIDLDFHNFKESEFNNIQILEIVMNEGIVIKE